MQYLGKYRATVIRNDDPFQMGRLEVQVSDVNNVWPATWAMPSVHFAGIQSGLFSLPAVGSAVWVEFEQGHPDHPVWVGGFWGSAAEVPALAHAAQPGVQTVVLQTTGQNTLMVSDAPGPAGGILLKSSSGASISISEAGIFIDNGRGATISLVGNSVSVNENALQIT